MIFSQAIDKYITDHSTSEDPELAELNRETHLKVINPRMLSGHLQGKLLEMISKMINPSAILEIGTYTGYSAICLAKGLKPQGLLHTIEKNDELLSLQKKYFTKAGVEDKIIVHHGNALEVIPQMNLLFDLVFIDAAKKDYSKFYNLVIDKTRNGGIIIADNVLWDGKVVNYQTDNDEDTVAIREFNKLVKNDMRTENLILPMRDGISVIRKL